MMDAALVADARRRIDAAHAADPARIDALSAELVYADRLEAAVLELEPAAGDDLRLAARCQHLERWAIPRADYPMDKAGYFAWRQAVHARQGERAEAILRSAGVAADIAARIRRWVAKRDPRSPAGQTLEDAACLVFFRYEVPAFAAKHPDYTAEKYMEIIRKTWRKMSPRGQAAARAIAFPPGLAELVARALAEG